MIGQTISHYRILARIGDGGMGVVYRAEDTHLKRTVALKFLHPGLTSDPEAKSRFIREAQAASAVQHPNICTVHEIQEADDGQLFICMDYYDGQTLGEIIKHRRLDPGEALHIAIQVADGLARAHEVGMAHRDIKPSNIVITSHGEVKILDFGLAKIVGQTKVTQHGTMLGTIGYMSLEQLRGEPTDCRTDVWSLGVVFFEMLAGHPPYQGKFDAEILYQIAYDEIDPVKTSLGDFPPSWKRVVHKALQKSPQDRYESAAELAHDLRGLHTEGAGPIGFQAGTPQWRRHAQALQPTPPSGLRARGPARIWRNLSRRSRRAMLGALIGGIGILAGVRIHEMVSRSSPPLPSRFIRLTEIPGQEGCADLSPDGSFFVFTKGRYGSARDIYYQRVGGRNPLNLTPDTEQDNCQPAISPDGTRIAFRSERDGGGIFTMGATGEYVRRVTDFGYNPSWSPDGRKIVVASEMVEGPFDRARTSDLWVIDVVTGDRRKITLADAVQPSWSPHGQRIAYWGLPTGTKVRDLWTVDSGGKTTVRLTNDAYVDWSPCWSSDGEELYFSSTRGGSMNLWRIHIDEETGEALGEPEPVPAPTEFAAFPRSARKANKLVYVSDNSRLQIFRVGFDPTRESVIPPAVPVTRGSKFAVKPSVSPDGRWITFRGGRIQEDIYLVSQDGQHLRQLTNDAQRDLGPRWMPDGNHIVFYSNRTGRNQIWQITSDGSGLTQLTNDTVGNVWAPRPFPDGRRLAYMAGERVRIVDLSQTVEQQTPVELPSPGAGLAFTLNAISPNGLWLAGYQRQANTPLPGIVVYSVESKTYRKVADHGILPEWLADSRRIICQDKGRFMIVDRLTNRKRDLGFPEEPLAVGVTFSISSDNRTIYYTRVGWEADIWLASME